MHDQDTRFAPADAPDAEFPGDRLGRAMRALCQRYAAEAAALPARTSSCQLHPDALPAQRTLNGRGGCIGCLTDPGNLDASPLPDAADE